MKRRALLLTGHICVGLGILGIFLPLMPTTIFLILAAACYAKSSQKMYHWLHHNKLFGKYLKDYREKKGTPASVKISTTIFLWLTIGLTIFLTDPNIWIKLVLLLIAISVTIHLIKLKSLKE
jgi:uncharacterized protein